MAHVSSEGPPRKRPASSSSSFREILLGQGATGRVFSPRFQPKVARKQMFCGSSSFESKEEQDDKQWLLSPRQLRELYVMTRLARKAEPFLLQAQSAKLCPPGNVLEIDTPLLISLAKSLSNPGLLSQYPPTVLVRWTQDLLQGLAILHDNGVLHLDVKPDNILLERTQEDKEQSRVYRARLADFGQSVSMGALLTRPGHYMMTILYTPPEVLSHPERSPKLEASLDMYSFGITLLEIVGTYIFGVHVTPAYSKTSDRTEQLALRFLMTTGLQVRSRDMPSLTEVWQEVTDLDTPAPSLPSTTKLMPTPLSNKWFTNELDFVMFSEKEQFQRENLPLPKNAEDDRNWAIPLPVRWLQVAVGREIKDQASLARGSHRLILQLLVLAYWCVQFEAEFRPSAVTALNFLQPQSKNAVALLQRPWVRERSYFLPPQTEMQQRVWQALNKTLLHLPGESLPRNLEAAAFSLLEASQELAGHQDEWLAGATLLLLAFSIEQREMLQYFVSLLGIAVSELERQIRHVLALATPLVGKENS